MLPINHPLNIARVSREAAAAMLEHSTQQLELKLARAGLAKRAYSMGYELSCAVTLSLLSIVTGLMQVGGAL